jgi:hypothetical protein
MKGQVKQLKPDTERVAQALENLQILRKWQQQLLQHLFLCATLERCQ